MRRLCQHIGATSHVDNTAPAAENMINEKLAQVALAVVWAHAPDSRGRGACSVGSVVAPGACGCWARGRPGRGG
eukprot:4153387-Alexandrium_andersonii.AAC.1